MMILLFLTPCTIRGLRELAWLTLLSSLLVLIDELHHLLTQIARLLFNFSK